MNFLHLLEAKRDGAELRPEQIQQLVSSYSEGHIPDYQMAAFLMAVFFRGLSRRETRTLTLAMRDSGEAFSWPTDPRPVVDKHSTGGIGDKVSLALAPLLACLGFRVPMISGRGLGITGGTLDKLESIPGFQTALPREQIELIVHEVGCVICGQTERMVPADKRLYALRDVTGTVPSIPLLVTSILSKKLAEGLESLVLDVKFGRAAFMKTRQEARKLARAMVTLGNECGVRTRALLSRMDTPLGTAVGNWLEIKEAAALLNQESDPALADLEEVVLACAAHLLVQTAKARTVRTAFVEARKCLHSGQPRNKWEQMLERQGADLPTYHKMLQMESQAAFMHDFCAARSGVVARCDARIIGEVVRDLGGGRLTQDSVLDLSVGLDKLAKPGDPIRKGSVLARIHSHDREGALQAREQLAKAFEISERAPGNSPRVVETVMG